jgi:hypothetical protein
MKFGFWHGVLAGSAATAILAAALAARREPPTLPAPRPHPAPAASAAADAIPAAEAATPRPAAPDSPKTVPRAQARPETPAAPTDPASLARSVGTLRVLPTLRMEAELPPAVVEWLDLSPTQQDELNRNFLEDGRRIYALLRRLAARDFPGVTIPTEDSYRVPATLWERATSDATLAPLWDKGVDEMLAIRRETLAKTAALLRPAQQDRLERLLGNFFSFEGAFTFSR